MGNGFIVVNNSGQLIKGFWLMVMMVNDGQIMVYQSGSPPLWSLVFREQLAGSKCQQLGGASD